MIYILPTNTCFGIACSIDDTKSYDRIYKIKKRSLDNPLAILVPDFKWLENNTTLTHEQVEFLKNYEKPFTIITDSPHVKVWMNYVNDENGEQFLNRGIYEKFAFRVAHNKTQERLLKENGPMFLTSANISSETEIYTSREIKKIFGEYIEKGTIKFVGENTGVLEKVKPSEIFEFVGETLEQRFIRR
ncbi:MAG: Sua5/YciO/YrdC/YwlC family protein [Candidatus Gracilibacteria bacterium]|nr:Sua5/YciO/YrdC/YwlC family protein [Candidatus Gracilibacteria bacterium]